MEWVAAGLAVAGLVSSIFGAKSAKSAANSAAGKEAALDLRTTQEKVYQLGQEERQLASQTRARTVGSGVKADKGSPLTILAEQARTFAREKLFTSQVGAEKAQLAQQRGKMVGQQAMYQGLGQATQYASTAFSLMPKYLGKQPGPG